MLLINYSFKRTFKCKTCPVTPPELQHGWIKTLQPATVLVKHIINYKAKKKVTKYFHPPKEMECFSNPNSIFSVSVLNELIFLCNIFSCITEN